MSYFLIILLVFLLVSVLQLTLKAKISFNASKNLGQVQIRFVGIRLFDRQISFHKKYIKLYSKKHKNIYLPIEFSKQSIQTYTDFQLVLFQKIYAKEISVYLNFGLETNPMISCLVCGYFDVISKILYAILSQKKKGVIYKSKVYPSFDKSVIKFQIKAKISLSFYDFLWSYLEAVISGKLKQIKESKKIYGKQKD